MFVDAKEESGVIRTAQVVQVKDFIHADRGPHAAGSSFLRSLLNDTLSSYSVLPSSMLKFFFLI